MSYDAPASPLAELAKVNLDLTAKLELGLGKSNEALHKIERRLARPPVEPVAIRLATTGPFPASGVLVLSLGGPELGRQWYVRSLVVGGLTPTTATAGRVDVFATAADLRNNTTLASIGLLDWRDQATTLPAIAFYGRGDLTIQPPENLFLVVSNSTAGQAIVAGVTIEETQPANVAQDFSL